MTCVADAAAVHWLASPECVKKSGEEDDAKRRVHLSLRPNHSLFHPLLLLDEKCNQSTNCNLIYYPMNRWQLCM